MDKIKIVNPGISILGPTELSNIGAYILQENLKSTGAAQVPYVKIMSVDF